ncbi:MAG: hypothetical protein WBD87_02060 [Candidatus Acidiferrales bacterium]
MNRIRALAVLIVVSVGIACSAFVMAQQQQTAPPRNPMARVQAVETSRDSRQTGVRVVRLINTAEAEYRHSHGRYATWDKLVPSGAISEHEKPGTMFQGLKLSIRPEVTPGWVLDLVTAVNGQGYELSLHNVSDECGFSFFSDQRGIQGGWIDCSVELKPSGN